MNGIKRGDNADADFSARTECIPALALVAFAQLVSWTGLQLAPTLGGPVLVGMTHSLSLAGLPLGVAFLSSAASAAVAERVVSRIGMRAFLGIGALLGALGTTFAAASTVSNSPTLLIAGIVIAGSGIGWCWLTRYEAAHLLGPARGRMALGLVVGVAGIGAVSGPLTIPLLKQASTAVGLAPSALPWLLVTALFIALSFATTRVNGTQMRRPRPEPVAGPAIMEELRRPMLVFSVVQGVMTAVMGIALVVWSRGTVPGLALARVMSVHFFGMFGLAPLLAQRIEPSTSQRALVLGGLITTVSTILVLPAAIPIVQGVAMFGVGLGCSFAYLAVSIRLTAVREVEGRRFFQGRADTLGQLVGGVAPIAAGLVLAKAGFTALVIGLAAISLAATLIGVGISRREWSRTPPS